MPARTLNAAVSFQGVGLFTAAPAQLTIEPAPASSGVRFIRLDAPHAGELPAQVASVAPPGVGPLAKLPSRNTVLLAPPACFVATIEHVMSALSGLGVFDAVVRIAGPEVPILDGSSLDFARALHEASTSAPSAPEPLVLRDPVSVSDGKGAIATATPRATPGASFAYRLDYTAVVPGFQQTASWDAGSPDAAERYLTQIAPARTFCLLAEAQALRAAGLFAHITPREMLVLGPDAKPIDNSFRFADEPARHKLLDLIGDVALLGRPIQADIVSDKGGHALTAELCRAILKATGRP